MPNFHFFSLWQSERRKREGLPLLGDTGDDLDDKPTLTLENVDLSKYDDDDDSEESDSDSDDSDDDEDEKAELERELARIRKEREEEKLRKQMEAEEAKASKRNEEALRGNPLLNMGNGNFNVKKRWYEDVVFRNQAKQEPKKQKKFINDTIRNSFHKKFLNKYLK